MAVGAAGGGAALAVASGPDSTGVIHACYAASSPVSNVPAPTSGNMRLIDPSAGQSCSAASPTGAPGERSISWNTVGPEGPPGIPGAPGRSVTIAGGNTFTISGGQVITVGPTPGVTLKPPAFGGRPVATLTLSGGLDLTTSVNSYNLGVTQAGGGGGSGRGTGKVQVHEFQITRTTDKSSAKLALACANGTHIKKLTLTFRKGGQTYLTYTFSDAAISSFQGGSNPHGDQATENIAFSYGKIKVAYTPQKK